MGVVADFGDEDDVKEGGMAFHLTTLSILESLEEEDLEADEALCSSASVSST